MEFTTHTRPATEAEIIAHTDREVGLNGGMLRYRVNVNGNFRRYRRNERHVDNGYVFVATKQGDMKLFANVNEMTAAGQDEPFEVYLTDLRINVAS